MNYVCHVFGSIFIFILCSCFASGSFSGEYSIQLRSTINQRVQYQVTVNGVAGQVVDLLDTSPTSAWINFQASPGDIISVLMIKAFWDYSVLSYVVNNGPGGSGVNIYDSKSTTFTPVNGCPEGTCTVSLVGLEFGDSTADFYLNNQLVLANYNGSEGQTIDIKAGDSIKVVFSYLNGGSNPIYYMYEESVEFYNGWYYNALGYDTLIFNSIRGPMGGFLDPITEDRSSVFASLVGAGNGNSEWIGLTRPI